MAAPDPPPPRKPDLYVVARFLDRLGETPAGVPRTRLQAAVRLNYDLYRSYLTLLVEKRYVTVNEDRIQLTQEGRHAKDRLVGWIRDAFGDMHL